MKIFLIVLAVSWLWLAWEAYHAPLMDEDGNIIKDDTRTK